MYIMRQGIFVLGVLNVVFCAISLQEANVENCTGGSFLTEEATLLANDSVIPVPTLHLEFQDWIFPGAWITCNGNITKLKLHLLSGGSEDATLVDSPEIQIWRKNNETLLETDYIKTSSISLQDPRRINEGVFNFEYELPTPAQVQEGDVLGYGIPANSAATLRYKLKVLQLGDDSSHNDDTLSFRITADLPNNVFDTNLRNGTVFAERGFVPIVAVEFSPVPNTPQETTMSTSLPSTDSMMVSMPTEPNVTRNWVPIFLGSAIGVAVFILIHLICIGLLAYCMCNKCKRTSAMNKSQTSTQINVYVRNKNDNRNTDSSILSPSDVHVSSSSEGIIIHLNEAQCHNQNTEHAPENITNIYETLTRETRPLSSTDLDSEYLTLVNQIGDTADGYSYVNDPSNDPDARIPVQANLAYISIHDLKEEDTDVSNELIHT